MASASAGGEDRSRRDGKLADRLLFRCCAPNPIEGIRQSLFHPHRQPPQEECVLRVGGLSGGSNFRPAAERLPAPPHSFLTSAQAPPPQIVPASAFPAWLQDFVSRFSHEPREFPDDVRFPDVCARRDF